MNIYEYLRDFRCRYRFTYPLKIDRIEAQGDEDGGGQSRRSRGGAVSGPIITADAQKSDKSWESDVELLVILGKFIELLVDVLFCLLNRSTSKTLVLSSWLCSGGATHIVGISSMMTADGNG